jgi:hypothetical protein
LVHKPCCWSATENTKTSRCSFKSALDECNVKYVYAAVEQTRKRTGFQASTRKLVPPLSVVSPSCTPRFPSLYRHSGVHNLPNTRYIFCRFFGSRTGTHGENDVFEHLRDEPVLGFDGDFGAVASGRKRS